MATGELTRAALHEHVATMLTEVTDASRTSELGRSSALESLATPEGLVTLATGVLADEGWLTEVAEQSFRHALGFDKFILVSSRPAGQLRVHVWWPDETRDVEHVHNHRFDFWSVVVAGQLTTHVFAESEIGRPMKRYRESSAPEDQRWSFEELAAVRVAPQLQIAMPAGTAYACAASVLHTIDVGSDLAVTMFLETESDRAWTTVYTELDAPPPVARPQVRFTESEVRDRFERLRDVLRTASHG